MTREDIISLPNKHLRQPSKKVGLITNEIQKVIDDMCSATLDWEDHRDHEVGVALAAVQINKLYKIIIVRNNFNDKSDRSFNILINPQITKLYGGIKTDYEGCLSIKDIYGKVPRHNNVKVKALGADGQEIRVSADGFLARVLQHEIDHIKGTVFIDHIKSEKKAFFRLDINGNLQPLEYKKEIEKNTDLWK